MMEQEVTLLIVDDEDEIRKGLRNAIDWQKAGIYLVGTAQNGSEALEMIREYLPDIVISDINMPEMDGLEMIAHAREEGYSGKFIILSGYDDFQYAQKAIRYHVDDYIIKPVVLEDLKKHVLQLKEKVEKIREQQNTKVLLSQKLNYANKILTEQNFISDFLSGELQGAHLKAEIEKKRLPLKSENAAAIIVYFYQKDICSDDGVSQASLAMLVEFLRKELVQWNPVVGYDARSCAVLMVNTQDERKLRQEMLRISQKIKSVYNLRSFVAVGDVVSDIAEIRRSYQNANMVSSWHIYTQLGSVAGVELLQKNSVYFSVDTQNIIKEIRQGDTEAVKREFQAYNDQLFEKNPMPSPAYLFSMYHFLITNIRTEISQPLETYTGDAYQAMRQFDTVEEIRRWIETLLVDYATEISIHQVELKDPVIEKAIEYIKAHIFQKVCAEDVCKYIGFSKAYFSKYFKDKTNLNFRDYLLDLKITYAQQQLASNANTPSELSVMLGYEEYSSFSRAFKMRTGFSPIDYQKNI